MSRNADIVIVGGGVIGLSCAFYLASDPDAGARRIVVIEREMVTGAGATGKNAGGVRAQFSAKVNIEFSKKSIEVFERFKDETGHQPIFHQCGYLFLLSTTDEVRRYEASAALQRSLGVPVDFLTPGDIKKLAPALSVDNIRRGNFSRKDGIIDPNDVALGYYQASRRLGVNVITNASVIGIDKVEEKIVSVRLKTGSGTVEDIFTECVINAAGPFARDVASMVGLPLPVEPLKRQIVTTGRLDFINPEFPMVVDVSTGLYCHRETPGLLLGWADNATLPSYDESVSEDYTEEILVRGMKLIPRLEDATIARAWAGLYETTPDHLAIIGRAPETPGMILVNGFSGHGLMHAPAAGMVVADVYFNRKPRLDISELAPERFAKGALLHEANVI